MNFMDGLLPHRLLHSNLWNMLNMQKWAELLSVAFAESPEKATDWVPTPKSMDWALQHSARNRQHQQSQCFVLWIWLSKISKNLLGNSLWIHHDCRRHITANEMFVRNLLLISSCDWRFASLQKILLNYFILLRGLHLRETHLGCRHSSGRRMRIDVDTPINLVSSRRWRVSFVNLK